MSRTTLYFFDQETLIDLPGDFEIFKKMLPSFYFLPANSFKDIKIVYNDTDSSVLSIENEKDFKDFLKKNIKNLYLDTQGDFELYEQYLEARDNMRGESKEMKRLNELLIKDEECTQSMCTKYKEEEIEIENLKKLIKEFEMRKNELEAIVKKGKDHLKKEQETIRKELTELQKKMGLATQK